MRLPVCAIAHEIGRVATPEAVDTPFDHCLGRDARGDSARTNLMWSWRPPERKGATQYGSNAV